MQSRFNLRNPTRPRRETESHTEIYQCYGDTDAPFTRNRFFVKAIWRDIIRHSNTIKRNSLPVKTGSASRYGSKSIEIIFAVSCLGQFFLRPWKESRLQPIEQFLGETPKVVDRHRFLHGGNKRAARLPVRRDAQDGAGTGNCFPCLTPTGYKFVLFDGVHRRTVTQKQHRHLWSTIK